MRSQQKRTYKECRRNLDALMYGPSFFGPSEEASGMLSNIMNAACALLFWKLFL